MAAIGRILNCACRLLLDTKFQGHVTRSIKQTGKLAKAAGKSRFSRLDKQIGTAIVRADKKTGGANSSFFNDMKKLINDTPKDVKAAWQSAKGLSLGKKLKTVWQPILKRVPILGNALMLAFSIPTIWQATKDEGLLGGALEAGKEVSKLTAGALGAAIGTAICPIPLVGSIGGWIAGGWLMSKVVGKSYLEKKQAAEEQKQELSQTTGTNQTTTPQFDMTTDMYENNPYSSAAGMSIPFGGQPTLSNEQLMQCYNALYGRNKIGLGDNNLNIYG